MKMSVMRSHYSHPSSKDAKGRKLWTGSGLLGQVEDIRFNGRLRITIENAFQGRVTMLSSMRLTLDLFLRRSL